MDLDLTPDQAGLIDAVGKLTAPFATQPAGAAQDFLVSAELEDRLTESGFREVATIDGMGAVDAVLLTEAVAALPYVTEFAASAIVAPKLGIPAGRPTVLMQSPETPTRFLTGGGIALIADSNDVRVMDLTSCDFRVLSKRTCAVSNNISAVALARSWVRSLRIFSSESPSSGYS